MINYKDNNLDQSSDLKNRFIWFEKMLGTIGVAWVLLHVLAVWRLPFSIDELKIIHLGIAATIILGQTALLLMDRSIFNGWFWFGMGVFILIITTYFLIDGGFNSEVQESES